MSEEEAAARADLRRAAGDLEAFRFRLLGIHASLPVSPREEAMLEGEEAPDFPTEARSVLECVLNDWIVPAIRALAELERDTSAEPIPIGIGQSKLPHSEDAERAVLGAILLDPARLETVGARLRPSQFYIHRHRIIYRALLLLQGKKVEIDLRTLRAQLEHQRQLEAVGGLAYLVSLDLDPPEIGSLDTHMATIEERSLLRRIQSPETEASHV